MNTKVIAQPAALPDRRIDGVSLLGGALVLLGAAQIVAGLTLRGLYADGAYYAAELWRHQGFVIIEPARRTAQLLAQAPVVLAMHLGASSPRAVATAFSLSTNLLPLALTGATLWLLPHRQRAWGLYPLFVFLAFGMSASTASIADGVTASAYAWALMMLLLFASGTAWAGAALLILAVGALRLHEAMSVLGPLLCLAALHRAARTEDRAACLLALLVAVLLLLGTAQGLWDLRHPRLPANRGAFLADLLGLRWLWADGAPNLMAVIGLAGLAALPFAHRVPIRWLSAAFGALALLAWLVPASPAASFAARGNACLASAPAMALLLWVRHRGGSPPGAAHLRLAAFLALALASADAAASWQWQHYTRAVQAVLTTEHGVIPWQDACGRLPPPARATCQRNSWPWTSPLMSLWLAPGGAVRGLIANRPDTVWQPFDPATLAPRLAEEPPPDRAAVLRAAFP